MGGTKRDYHDIREHEITQNPEEEKQNVLKRILEQYYSEKDDMIELDDNYRITANSNECTLQKKYLAKRKDDKPGEWKKGEEYISWKGVAFQSNLGAAFNSYLKTLVRERVESDNKESLQQFIKWFEELKKEIETKFNIVK